jgi:hypothetical protein
MANGPDSWEDLHKGGQKLKAKGFPIGIGLAHHDDSRASWRAIMHHRLPRRADAGRGRGLPAVRDGGRPRPVRDRQDDLEQTIKGADEKIKAIYAKFA